MKQIFKYALFLAFCLFMCFFIYRQALGTDNSLSKVDLSKVNSLMIVAHPDDETIWGGAHLLSDDYLVVCITCGNKKNRVEEFKQALVISNDQYLMLNYPDKVRDKRDDWATSKKGITEDLKKIMQLKNWDKIVTHNEEGEYGHIHHKMTHRIVTSIYKGGHGNGRLYFFGKYYKKNDIDLYKDSFVPISKEKSVVKINQMIEVYRSQSFIKVFFGHMFFYENWTEYIL